MMRSGIEPSDSAREADAVTIMLSGPVMLACEIPVTKHGFVCNHINNFCFTEKQSPQMGEPRLGRLVETKQA